MNTDAITALVNLSRGLHNSGIALVIALGVLCGVFGAIHVLSTESRLARQVPGHNGAAKVYVALLVCGMLTALTQVINATAREFGSSGTTFDQIAYISDASFGVAAQAANAMLTLVQTLGVVYALMGILCFRRAMKDGHTGLSAGEDVSSGFVRLIVGVLAACNPWLLDALQHSLGIAF